MKIDCDSCGNTLLSSDINIDNMLGKCRTCGNIVDLRTHFPRTKNNATHRGVIFNDNRTKKLDVPLPEKMTIKEIGYDLIITRKWFSPMFIFLVFFCVIWDGFLLVWYNVAGGDMPLIAKLFPLGHVAVGIGLTYYTIAGFVNETIITANRMTISVAHKPMPWIGAKTISATDIEQLYCEEKRSSSKNGTSYTYNVNVINKNKQKVKLISGLGEKDQAFFIEQRIEAFLKIENQAVAGEIRY